MSHECLCRLAGVGLGVGLAVAGAIVPAEGLEPGKSIDQYVTREWGLSAGLPQSSVSAIAQTRDRYLWVGTFGGLARFDGARFRTFGIEDGLPSLRILSLLVDRHDRVWVGTEDAGVARLDRTTGRFVRLEEMPALPVWALAEDGEGTVWIGTDHGLFAFDGSEIGPVYGTGEPSRLNVSSFLVDRQERLWVGTRGAGLMVRESGELRPLALPTRDTEWVLDLTEDPSGNIWAYSGGGLLRIDDRHPELVHPFQDPRIPAAAIRADRDGNLWLGGPDLTRREGGELVSGLQVAGRKRIRTLFEDAEGTLWLGTDGRGLLQLSDGPLTTYSTDQGIAGHAVLPITEGPDGAIWLGTRCGGLNRFDGERFHRVLYDENGGEDCIFSLMSSQDGTLWISDTEGLAALRDGTVTRFGAADGLPEGMLPRVILQDRAATIWGGTGRGLLRFDGEGFSVVGRDDGLVDDRVWSLAEDPRGGLWIGTETGVARWKEGEIEDYRGTESGIPPGAVRALLPDADGEVLWIGTYGGGLARLEGDVVTRYLPEHGLPDDVVSSILLDDRGTLWMCGNRGLFGVARAELEAVAQGSINRVAPLAFGISDGMKSPECNGGGQPSAWKARDGRLWFATIDGVAVLDPARPLAPPVPPTVLVETLSSGGRSSSATSTITLAGSRDLQIEYTGISFTAPERVRFRYRLSGFDDDWVEVGSRRAAYYTNLPRGRYRFEVEAGFEPGEWIARSDPVVVTARARFHETPLFALLVAFVIGLGFLAVHRLRIHHLKAREAELSALVEARTSELVESHRKLERLNQRKNELLGMAAHDLRNPLSAIQAYSDLVRREIPEGPDQPATRFLDHVRSLAEHTLDLVNELLDVSAIEAGLVRVRPTPLFLPDLVAEALSLYRVLADEKRIDLNLQPIHEVTVRADPDRLGEILSNLLSNAVKFTPSGGRVTVWSEVGDQSIAVFVQDSGPGLAPSELERAFRGGRLSARPTAGEPSTGFGLVIVRKLVELHGGEVRVQSRAGEGATFSFTLPLAA